MVVLCWGQHLLHRGQVHAIDVLVDFKPFVESGTLLFYLLQYCSIGQLLESVTHFLVKLLKRVSYFHVFIYVLMHLFKYCMQILLFL